MANLEEEVLYPDRCDECPHRLRENYGATIPDECIKCERMAPYGVYKTPSGKLVIPE